MTTVRTAREIVAGDALTWANLTPDELRTEHEILRRALETAYRQISLWSPIVARLDVGSLRRIASRLKHGPAGSGDAGPCDEDCAKCGVERMLR